MICFACCEQVYYSFKDFVCVCVCVRTVIANNSYFFPLKNLPGMVKMITINLVCFDNMSLFLWELFCFEKGKKSQ